jgi:hypothetical protein
MSIKQKPRWQPKEVLVEAEVDNPMFTRDHRESRSNPRKVRVAKNLLESAVETLYARGRLDEAQKKAADRFRATWEACGGAGSGAMDYSRTHVDGGGARDPISERQVDAGRSLRDCRVLLGQRNYDLVSKVCGQGLSLQDIERDQRARLTMADNLRSSLDDLGKMWGLLR